ncbi:MAG TPA: 6-carboxyhexanoate--CoA ligase [Acidaminococcaceae bacterium]|nr:6-carboxyhexanoate--CoA ligase [Acidaminococcaceae bacterium]
MQTSNISKQEKCSLFSLKMRAAQGGPHEKGGRHISGEERIVGEKDVECVIHEMLLRAKGHQRGQADFVNIKLQVVDKTHALYKPVLSFSECSSSTAEEGRGVALKELVSAGVSAKAARMGIDAILALPDSMRGAMLLNSETGSRMDRTGNRGVRVSNMDVDNPADFAASLLKHGLKGDHVREALVLASKVAAGDGVVAELCWSDDPLYVTGYVGSGKNGYRRIPVLKKMNCGIGGRVFFVKPGTDIVALTEYLEEQIVFITAGANGYITKR